MQVINNKSSLEKIDCDFFQDFSRMDVTINKFSIFIYLINLISLQNLFLDFICS